MHIRDVTHVPHVADCYNVLAPFPSGFVFYQKCYNIYVNDIEEHTW